MYLLNCLSRKPLGSEKPCLRNTVEGGTEKRPGRSEICARNIRAHYRTGKEWRAGYFGKSAYKVTHVHQIRDGGGWSGIDQW